MTLFFWIVFAVVFLFGFVLIFGAPYLPTLSAQQKLALEMLDLRPGQVLYDLGSGDGRLLKAAARRGITAVGYELNPLLAAYSWVTTRRYGEKVKIVCGNFWRCDISKADGVFVFLLDRHMPHLDEFLSKHHKKGQLNVVSHGFKIPGKKIMAKKGAMYLYKY